MIKIDWEHFAYMGDRKGGYIALEATEVCFIFLVEGEPLFSLALLRLRVLYPGAYTWGSTSTCESLYGIKILYEGTEGDRITLPGSAATEFFSAGGFPSLIWAH